MKLRKECIYCDVEMEFTEKNIKKRSFCKPGDRFIENEEESRGKGLDEYPKRFHKIEYEVTELLMLKFIKCPICGNINWIEDISPSGLTSIEEDGWWLRRYAKIKCNNRRVVSSTEWYNK